MGCSDRLGTSARSSSLSAALSLAALVELSPRFADLSFSPRFLTLGGFISGFFGGAFGKSGRMTLGRPSQGWPRNQTFVATGVVYAEIVDRRYIALERLLR